MKERFCALKNNAYGRLAILFIVCLIPFTVARALIYIINHPDFAVLSAGQVISAFIVGLRFDASIMAMVVGLPLLLMLLPFGLCHRRFWQGICGWVTYIMLVAMVFLIVADMFYFSLVHRHAGPEVSVLGGDIATMIQMAIADFPLELTLFAIAAAVGAWWWRPLLVGTPTPPTKSGR